MNKPEIKAGMLVQVDKLNYLVINDPRGFLVGISNGSSWNSQISNTSDVVKIGWPKGYSGDYTWEFGEILWERPYGTVTMQEIADKFGIPIDKLKIKK